MKILYSIILSLFIAPIMVSAQHQHKGPSCCQNSATEEFALLATNTNFNMSHPNPLPYKHHSETGKDITYKTADGKTAHAYALMAKEPTNDYIFVIHEWWGLNDYIKRESEKLYKDLGSVNVLALDLYDEKVADSREKASQYMREVSKERAREIIQGALNYVGRDAEIGTIGWCFGGGWSLQTALLAKNQAKGCVIYYGMPEKNVEKLQTLNCDVLGIFGTQDPSINPKVVKEFEGNMQKAGKKLIVHNYDAVHAFANPSNPKYNKTATANAWVHTVSFFKKRMEEDQ